MSKRFDNVEFLTDQEREYFASAVLSIELEKFLTSSVGMYLHGRAKIEYDEAKEEALACNPFSWFGRRKLAKAQEKAQVAKKFMTWCAEAIVDGRAAEQQLNNNNN